MAYVAHHHRKRHSTWVEAHVPHGKQHPTWAEEYVPHQHHEWHPNRADAYVPRCEQHPNWAEAYVPHHHQERHSNRNEAYVPHHMQHSTWAEAYVPHCEQHPTWAEAYVPHHHQERHSNRNKAYVPHHMKHPTWVEAYVPHGERHPTWAGAYVPHHMQHSTWAKAYNPHHKQHSTWAKGRTLKPRLRVTEFQKKLNLSPSENFRSSDRFTYAKDAIHRWIPIGLDEVEQIPRSIQLQLFPVEYIKRRAGCETLELVNVALDSEPSKACSEHWRSIAENVLQDLLASFQVMRNQTNGQTSEEAKPALVVRLGKILFYSENPSNMSDVTGYSPTVASLGPMRKIFYATIPPSYINYIKSKVVPEFGVEFRKEKDVYLVQLSDTSRPGAIISCKCRVSNGASRLEHYKIELNLQRHMIVDTSCLNKNLDLRLMLCSKTIITTLTNEERKSITNLFRSAVPDGDEEGGIRWSSGKVSSDNRFKVVGVWHTVYKTYESSSIKLKLRHADRFDFRTSAGEVAWEVVMKLKRVASALSDQKLETDSISKMLEGELKLIWDKLLPN